MLFVIIIPKTIKNNDETRIAKNRTIIIIAFNIILWVIFSNYFLLSYPANAVAHRKP